MQKTELGWPCPLCSNGCAGLPPHREVTKKKSKKQELLAHFPYGKNPFLIPQISPENPKSAFQPPV
jgi:hypothetical protein